MEAFLKKLKSWLIRWRRLPFLGPLAEDLLTALDLARDYSRGVYRSIPRGSVLALILGLAYALSPVDLLLDVIPVAGLLDDAALLALLLEFGIAGDLTRYRAWRDPLRLKGREVLRSEQARALQAAAGKMPLGAALLTEQKEIRLLLCLENTGSLPIPCREVLCPIPEQQLSALGVESWEELGEFYTGVFRDTGFSWSSLGPRPFMPEYDPRANTGEFRIVSPKGSEA